jgi:hypothetical protein
VTLCSLVPCTAHEDCPVGQGCLVGSCCQAWRGVCAMRALGACNGPPLGGSGRRVRVRGSWRDVGGAGVNVAGMVDG